MRAETVLVIMYGVVMAMCGLMLGFVVWGL